MLSYGFNLHIFDDKGIEYCLFYFLCNLMCCITIVILMESLSYIIPRGS